VNNHTDEKKYGIDWDVSIAHRFSAAPRLAREAIAAGFLP
jgi:hypothetical protein